jgi:hypothetical protein
VEIVGPSADYAKSGANGLDEGVDQVVENRIALAQVFDLPNGVDHGRVMLPAETLPISGSEAFVRALHKYIATWRGMATDLELFRDFNSAILSW